MQNGEVLYVGHVEPSVSGAVAALDSSAEEVHNLGAVLVL